MYSDTKINDCRLKNTKDEKLTCKRLSIANAKYEWLRKLTYESNRKESFLSEIWLSIFAVNARSFLNPFWITDQIHSIENFQFSNYEKLLFSQLTNPGLLAYFNAFRNTKNNPNENLGRELLELYTVGESNFSEIDVRNTSLALTGLILDKENKVRQSNKFHFQGETTILGKMKNYNLRSLINWLVKQPSTAENVVKRFFNYLIGEDVNIQDISKVIEDFKESNLDLKTLYKSINSNEKYINCKKFGSRLLDPTSLVSKTISLIGSKHPNNLKIGVKILNPMGQKILEPPNPKGWPFGEGWLTSSRIFYRKKGLKMIIADEEIWETRNTPGILSKNLVPFNPLNIRLPAEPTKENLITLVTDPAWNFSGPIDLNY
tara:strand:- start:519 stop:1643 length:1125 start_codon:yes stop_codon:yes gene_type:complete